MVNTNQMTKYQAYPNYSKSGIELVDAIPSTWQVKALKYNANVTMGQSPDSDDYEHEENGLPFLQGNAEFNRRNPKARLWCQTANKHCRKDDILLSVRAPVGAINLADQVYGIGRGLCAIRGIAYHQTFLTYLLGASNETLNVLATGSTFTAVSIDDVKSLGLPLPSYTEQQEIADFLDRKTALIDDVIDKKQKLIKLLKEKRQALITHAVTKGLDPNVKLKPSGIDWLWDIPEHWDIKRLKFVALSNTQSLPEYTSDDYRFRYLDIGNVGTGYMITEPVEMIFENAPSRARRVVAKSDTIISTVRTYLKAIYHFEDNPKGIIVSTGFAVIKPSESLHSKYFYYLSLSENFIDSIVSNSYGVSYPAINESFLMTLPVWYPTIEEQKNIVSFLDRETVKIDDIVAKVKSQIWKLREYKQTLITNAVTGKIRVTE